MILILIVYQVSKGSSGADFKRNQQFNSQIDHPSLLSLSMRDKNIDIDDPTVKLSQTLKILRRENAKNRSFITKNIFDPSPNSLLDRSHITMAGNTLLKAQQNLATWHKLLMKYLRRTESNKDQLKEINQVLGSNGLPKSSRNPLGMISPTSGRQNSRVIKVSNTKFVEKLAIGNLEKAKSLSPPGSPWLSSSKGRAVSPASTRVKTLTYNSRASQRKNRDTKHLKINGTNHLKLSLISC